LTSTVSFLKESVPLRTKVEPEAMTTVPPEKVQVVQEQLLLIVRVTPGEILMMQLLQMEPGGYMEVLVFEVMFTTVCAVAAWEKAVSNRMGTRCVKISFIWI
jgi:hypothetical protein